MALTHEATKHSMRWLHGVVLAAFAACSVYDPSLLDALDEPRPGGVGGTGGSGAGGVPDAGGGPTGEICGDGAVGRNEKCDSAIAAGLPGACPNECGSGTCPERALMGIGCERECVDLPIPCGRLDRCCGRSCTKINDMDCSIDCGNGVVDGAMGETCEPGSVNDCPASCDDADPCTTDIQYGAAQNCNVVCERRPVVTPTDGDGCCPPDGRPDNDDDCVPVP